MNRLTDAGRALVSDIARRHGVSDDAAISLLFALSSGGGTQAQFNISELGGMGQWQRGGMIMVGDMFNQGLKYRVDALCNDLSALLYGSTPVFAPPPAPVQSQFQGGGTSLFISGGVQGSGWPAELGSPSSSGSQNNLRYAVFPFTRRLAVDQGGVVTVYDTGDHQIGGVSQQQSGDQSLTFTSQYGLVRLADLPVVSPGGDVPPPPPPVQPSWNAPAPDPVFQPAPPPVAAPAPAPVPPAAPSIVAPSAPGLSPAGAPGAPMSTDDIFAKLERLAELRQRGIITDADFEAKKADLLSRL